MIYVNDARLWVIESQIRKAAENGETKITVFDIDQDLTTILRQRGFQIDSSYDYKESKNLLTISWEIR